MTTKYSVTITCDDRPGGGFACTASYTTRLVHPGESPSHALSAARLMGWTQVPDPMGGYADRCPACSLLAGSKPAPPPIAPQGKCAQCPVPKPTLSGGFEFQDDATWACPTCGQDWIFAKTGQNSGTWWRMTVEGGGHAYSCKTPAFNLPAAGATLYVTGETWTCACGKVWVADREQEIWYPQGTEHPCGRVPTSADRTRPWHCHCGQGWEYSQDVKAWTKLGYEE